MTPVLSKSVSAFTIDVEDWHHCILHDPTQWPHYEDRIVASTSRLLDIIEEHGVRATCFILGYVADSHPELVREIDRRGHEIATHGYAHRFVYDQTPEAFRSDLERSVGIIGRITGEPPVGYRAPYFSITRKSLWAYDVLVDMGFTYDSSVYPVVNHRYGMPRAPRFAHYVRTGSDASLVELPITTLRMLALNVPIGGGFYFRAAPYPLFRMAWLRVLETNRPGVFYMHPWEVDPDQPTMDGINPLFKARRYLNLDKMERKLRQLLSEFRFAPVREAFDHLLTRPGRGGK